MVLTRSGLEAQKITLIGLDKNAIVRGALMASLQIPFVAMGP